MWSATTSWLHALTVWPAAARAAVGHRLAERAQHRLGPLDVGPLAAGHDGQCCGGRAFRAAARNWRIDEA